MNFDHLRIQRHDAVALITIARPDRLNALNLAIISELDEAVASLVEEDEIGALVVTGDGPKAFVAGADIAEIRSMSAIQARRFAQRGQALMRRIETASKPVVAAVNGFALGGGLELALSCHLRYASRGARLGLPEVKLGLIPGFGGTQRLARAVGRQRALEMMLTGEPIDADAAFRYGLLLEVLAPDALLEHAIASAARLAQAAPVARERILASVDAGLDLPLERALALEISYFAECCASEDMREGTGAFLEKRKPAFRGR